MTETKHSPEPWRLLGEYGTPWAVEAANGDNVGQADQVTTVHADPAQTIRTANARRIVACVNALAGVPTEALEAGALGRALDALTDEVRSCSWGGNADGADCLAANRDKPCRACRVVAALRALRRLP